MEKHTLGCRSELNETDDVNGEILSKFGITERENLIEISRPKQVESVYKRLLFVPHIVFSSTSKSTLLSLLHSFRTT